ncbi:MAG TPA: hypothetical protein VE860_15385, partial [Chthoniobacterales bacterium]|nr:hypothetical protein [Chthoniobacterales bacterium]
DHNWLIIANFGYGMVWRNSSGRSPKLIGLQNTLMGVPWLNIQHIVRQTSIIRRLRLPAKVLLCKEQRHFSAKPKNAAVRACIAHPPRRMSDAG